MALCEPYRAIVERFPEGIVFVFEEQDDLRYTFVGGEGLDDIGLTKAQLEGQVVAADRPADIKSHIHSQYRRALDGECVTFEAEAEGRHFQFQLRPVVDDDGDVTAGVGFARDITERMVYREELERQNDRLEEFTQLVFHDIRNPLNVAKGRLEMLEAESDSEHVDAIREALETIESLTSGEPAPLDEPDEGAFERITLGDAATAAWRNVATKDATLRVDLDHETRADPEGLRRLFENLFRNAVEHGGEAVTVTVGPLDDGFYVEDDGSGIDAAGSQSLFERGVSYASEGTGLGLFIVESVVDAHGWEVGVTESADGGARFEITGVDPPA